MLGVGFDSHRPLQSLKDLRCNSIFLIFRYAVIKRRKCKSDLFHWHLIA